MWINNALVWSLSPWLLNYGAKCFEKSSSQNFAIFCAFPSYKNATCINLFKKNASYEKSQLKLADHITIQTERTYRITPENIQVSFGISKKQKTTNKNFLLKIKIWRYFFRGYVKKSSVRLHQIDWRNDCFYQSMHQIAVRIFRLQFILKQN